MKYRIRFFFFVAQKKKLSVWGSNSRPWRYQQACNIYPK